MQAGYQVGVLGEEDVLRAFALVRAVMPWIEMERWRGLMSEPHRRSDWLAALDADSYIHGLCMILSRRQPRLTDTLDVPVFAPVSLFDEKGVADAMLAAVRACARDKGCERIHVWSAPPSGWDELAGHITAAARPQGMVFYVFEGSGPARH